MKRLVVTTMLLLLPAALFANVPEIGWPRAIEAAEGEIVIYQPQLDSLEGDKLTGRAAVSVALTGSEEPVFGVIRFESRMETDRDARTMRIVDLDITAPDVQSSGRETSYTTIPVQMSLRLELFDSETGQIVGRVIDHRRADTTVSSRQTSSVGNMADAERILRHWSALVRAHLESRAE